MVSALFALFALVACAAGRRPAPAAFVDNEWRLAELNGNPALTTEGRRRAYLRFARDSARVSGSTGCNRFTGTFTRAGQTLRFGPTMATTRMACVELQINQQERAFLAALQATQRYEVTGDTLTLSGASGTLARFATGAP